MSLMDQILGYNGNVTSSNSTSTSTVWTNYPIQIHGSNAITVSSTSALTAGIPSGTYTTNSTYSVSPKVDIKRCRTCNHAHIEGQKGCIEAIDYMVFYKECPCNEYLPKDNLEYLEYLDKKKESH